MWTCFTLHKFGERLGIVSGLFLLGSSGVVAGIHVAPSCKHNLLSGGFELHFVNGGIDGGLQKFAIGIESGDEALRNHIIDPFLVGGEGSAAHIHVGGDDSMVVGNLAVVKHLFAFWDARSIEHRLGERGIGHHVAQNFGHFGIDILAKIGGIDTRIGGYLLLVERLDEAQSLFGREAEFLVALHLERCEVEKARRSLPSFLGGDVGDFEEGIFDVVERLLSLCLHHIAPFH